MYKKFISLLFSAIFCFTLICNAQIGGKGVFRFLNLPNSAKVAALGNGLPMSTKAEFNETFANPSLIETYHQNSASLNYSNYLSDINFGSVQYGLKFKEKHTISLGLMFINYGNFDEYTEAGNPTGGNFTAGDYLLNIGYAKNWKEKIYYGANAKIIYGSYDIYNSFAIATDIALTYKDTIRNIATGLILKNIGYQVSAFNQTRENLPFQMALSFTQKLRYAPFKYHITYNNLHQFDLSNGNTNDNESIDLISGESKNNKYSFVNKFSRHLIFGTEILLSQSFNLQAGYNMQQSKELSIDGLGSLSGFSFGFSLHLKKLSLSYAHSTLNLAGSNNYFSIALNPSFLGFK